MPNNLEIWACKQGAALLLKKRQDLFKLTFSHDSMLYLFIGSSNIATSSKLGRPNKKESSAKE